MVRNFDRPPALDGAKLFKRDRHMCAYCGGVFKDRQLEMEHVYPEARGGPTSWMNLVTCNSRKKCRTPEEAGMKLLYLPYPPNMYEDFILSGRDILADQMEFLKARIPKASRLHPASLQ